MADAPTDNPAGRLHGLLGDLKQYYSQNRSNQREPRVHEGLAHVWGLTWPDQRPAMLRMLADVSSLPEQVVAEMTALGEHPHVDLEEDLEYADTWKDTVTALVDLSAALAGVVQQVSEGSQKDLRLCARTLSVERSQAIPPAENLVDLTKEVNSLIEEVLAADLDEDLRAYLLWHLQSMHEALIRVRVHGGGALVDVYARLTVDLARHQDVVRRAARQEPSLVQRVGQSLARFGAVVSLASDFSGIAGFGLAVAELDRAPSPVTTIQVLVVQDSRDGDVLDAAVQPPALSPAPMQEHPGISPLRSSSVSTAEDASNR